MGAKPYASKEEEEEARIGGALRNLERWGERTGASFSGSVRVQGQVIGPGRNEVSRVHTVAIGDQRKDPPGMTRLPRGTSLDEVSQIFAERDRAKAKAADDGAIIDPVTITVASIENVQTDRKTPIRVLKYPSLRWLYKLITEEQEQS